MSVTTKNNLSGVVIKGVGGVFSVATDGGVYVCTGRKKLRRDGNLTVGDYVELTVIGDGKDMRATIESVRPKKNFLVRPPVANIDILMTVVAPEPKPELSLVDKILINCLKGGVRAAVCVNKTDIASPEFVRDIRENYENVCDVLEVSAVGGFGLDAVLAYISGKTVCLAGQSGVGKSSLINALLGAKRRGAYCENAEFGVNLEVGGLIKKTRVGRQTTRKVEIYSSDGWKTYGQTDGKESVVDSGFRVVDSAGFAVYDIDKIDLLLLHSYYPDFDEFRTRCKYGGNCTHTKEDACAVKSAVQDGKIKKARYNRYLALFEEIKAGDKR